MDDFTSVASNDTALHLSWLREYANRRINSSLMDARRSIPPYIVLDFGNEGLLGMQAPVSCGGLDLNNEDCMAVSIQLGAIDLNLAIFVGLHNCLGIRPIMNYSQPAIRDELLPEVASGRKLTAFGLTEPGAGSNAGAIEGKAELMPNGNLKLNGTKIWIGNASWAGVINIFQRYYDENGKPQGIGGYVVKQGTPGLEMGPELMTMGLRGMVQNRFTMNDLIVEPQNQLGELGRGLDVAQDAMMYARLALGAAFLGAMKRCLQLMLRYADRRKNIATGRLLDNPISMMSLSTLTVKSQALENLIHYISRSLDQEISLPEEFLITAKVTGSEFLWQAADSASQMLGGRGYLESNEVSQILRNARVGRVFEGPTETMMYYMGSRFVLNSDVLNDFLRSHLSAGDITEQMLEARDIVQARCKQLQAPFNLMRRVSLTNSLLGEIVSWGIIYAVTRHLEKENTEDHSRVAYWAQQKFEQSIVAAKSNSLNEFITLDPNELKELVNGYELQVGNMEQQLPGEEWNLDPYLRFAAE